MRKIYKVLRLRITIGLVVFFGVWTQIFAYEPFGYMSYSTYNIGDDIQSIAAKQFLPKNSMGIDREFCATFKSKIKVHTIMNGWFMHTKNVCWQRFDLRPPQKSWPPSSDIDPLLISIHLTKGFYSEAFSKEGIKFFNEHAPIGARDMITLYEFQKRGIPCFFSGCLTLTLKNDCHERNNIIYAVDIGDECVEFIKSKTHCEVVKITHGIDYETACDPKKRLNYANDLIEKYKKAKCVITSRLHAAMPCLALETPVLFITFNDSRFEGLKELTNHCTKEDFLNGKIDFDFDNPKENPKDYLIIRENLIKTVTDWANRHGSKGYSP